MSSLKKYRRLMRAARAHSHSSMDCEPVSRRRLEKLLRRLGWTDREIAELDRRGLIGPLGYNLVARGVLHDH